MKTYEEKLGNPEYMKNNRKEFEHLELFLPYKSLTDYK